MSFSEVFEVSKDTIVVELEHCLPVSEFIQIIKFLNVQFYFHSQGISGDNKTILFIDQLHIDKSDVDDILSTNKSVIDYSILKIEVNK